MHCQETCDQLIIFTLITCIICTYMHILYIRTQLLDFGKEIPQVDSVLRGKLKHWAIPLRMQRENLFRVT